MGGAADEFPLLAAHGLYAADIRGDGTLDSLAWTLLETSRISVNV
jgi:hypothetical protein